MNRGQEIISGIGLGALLMYAFDPATGRRRRSRAVDKITHASHKLGDAAEKSARDLKNRTRGMVAETRSRFTSEKVPDEVLVERVRSKMGRVVSHPGAIEVTASNGRVRLRGVILKHEVKNLRRAVSSVRGVTEVDDQLDVRKQRDDLSSLQGGAARPGMRSELAERHWTPAVRVLAGLAGGSLLAYGIRSRKTLGLGLSTVGLSLTARALTNLELRRLTGIRAGHRAVDVQKMINIAAPVEEVFVFWDNYENFPRFMRNVREVTDRGNGRLHWVVAGPLGTAVEWEAVVTERIPNEVLAWRTVSGPSVENAGIVRFLPNPDGTTRVDIRLSYNPPAGAIGHAVATLFGADPKTEMDEDLVRMKTLIETGNPPHDASRPEEQTS